MRRGGSIARWMAIIAVLALTCGTLRLFLELRTLGGLLLPALGIQAGLIGVLLTRDRARRFWTGFALACVVAPLLVLIVVAQTDLSGGSRHFTISYRLLPAALRTIVTAELHDYRDTPGGIGPVTGAVLDVMLGLPQLLVALLGGLLTATVRLPRRRSKVVEPMPVLP